MVYKEGTDQTLLGPVQVTAVNWIGVITQLWYGFVFENDKTFVGCSHTVVHFTVYTPVLRCV
jgi:hypothetical protein